MRIGTSGEIIKNLMVQKKCKAIEGTTVIAAISHAF
jgi:hypothetical protein